MEQQDGEAAAGGDDVGRPGFALSCAGDGALPAGQVELELPALEAVEVTRQRQPDPDPERGTAGGSEDSQPSGGAGDFSDATRARGTDGGRAEEAGYLLAA